MFREEILELHHKEILGKKLKTIDTMISEYNFANLYLFKKKHNYSVVQVDNHIFIKGTTYDKIDYLMPTTEIHNLPQNLIERLTDKFILFPIDEKWINDLKGEFQISYNENDSDYIYTVEKISTYKGRKLHKKRNLLKQFLKLYNHRFEYIKDYIHDAKTVLDIWLEENNFSKEETDYYACLEALSLKNELELCGIIYYVENEPAGFILGEEHNQEVFVIHFAKGLKKFKGIYQFIYNDFAKRLPKTYKYLNFEQDLGQMALRKAKSSYYPDIMLKKYRISKSQSF